VWEVNSAFSANVFLIFITLGRCPGFDVNVAPSALV
jgi:hypothetical protein